MSELKALWEAVETLQREISLLKRDRDGSPRSRASNVFQMAKLHFDGKAEAWLETPLERLGGRAPIDAALESREGQTVVLHLLVEMSKIGRGQDFDAEFDDFLRRNGRPVPPRPAPARLA
jgi:uncharacterized protein (DUF2384 family)